jgi:ATP-dependent Clp protease adaptor protein ClpS
LPYCLGEILEARNRHHARGDAAQAAQELPIASRRYMEETTTLTPKLDPVDQEQRTPLYHVVLLDDDQHTYEYVIEMLQKLFLLSESAAFRHAYEVDTTGRTIVITCELPQAEFARDQIHAYGPDWRMPNCKGSMSAVIEPASNVREYSD